MINSNLINKKNMKNLNKLIKSKKEQKNKIFLKKREDMKMKMIEVVMIEEEEETPMKTEGETAIEEPEGGNEDIIQTGIKEIKAIVRHSEDIIIIETEEDLDLLIKRKLIKQKVSLELAQNHKSKKILTQKKKEEGLVRNNVPMPV